MITMDVRFIIIIIWDVLFMLFYLIDVIRNNNTNAQACTANNSEYLFLGMNGMFLVINYKL